MNSDYLGAFNGGFSGILRWAELDTLWAQLRQQPEGWYVYAVGEAPPALPATTQQLEQFLARIDPLLREHHDVDYCGIVYVDNRTTPNFIKIYDPNNLGTVCGISKAQVLPGWTLSHLPPVDLPQAIIPPAQQRRWWHKIFAPAPK